MNYSNMIEEKHLKKGFIIATLASTVIGTFTATLALHDKIKERTIKQKETDGQQSDEIKALKEQVDKLTKGSEEDGTAKEEKKARSSRSRSRSSSRSRSRRRRRRRQYSYDDDYAYGRTEDPAMIQHVVVGVIHDAMRKNPNLTEADVQKLVLAAEEAARDGTVETLQGHYQRLVLPAAKPLTPDEQHRKLPVPLDLPKGQRPSQERPPSSIGKGHRLDQERPYHPRSVAGSHHESHLGNLPDVDFDHKPGLGRHLEERKPAAPMPPTPLPLRRASSHRANSLPAEAAAPSARPVDAPQRARSTYSDPFEQFKRIPPESPTTKPRSAYIDPFATLPNLPPQQMAKRDEKDSKSTKAEAPKSRAPSQAAATERKPSSNKTEIGKSRPLPHQSDWQPPRQKYDDPFSAAKSVKVSAVERKDAPPAKSKRGDDPRSTPAARSVATVVDGEPVRSRRDGEAPSRAARPKSDAPPKSTKPEPSKSRAPAAFVAPMPVPAPPLGPSAQASRSTHHSPAPVMERLEVHETIKRRTSVSPPKALPAPPNNSLFCRYATSLQTNPLPLHPNFSSSGSHRCPTCAIAIPVDTRDVWVLSTAFSTSPTSLPVARDYRMDARFVTKCHTEDGTFACVLCERFRERDCICKSVDALVKHLGTEHTPEEFERDGDLVRMEDGRRVVRGRRGAEMALA